MIGDASRVKLAWVGMDTFIGEQKSLSLQRLHGTNWQAYADA
jgi:hypothetical protein